MSKTILAVEVRDMHTAGHVLFPIKCKPKTTMKKFRELEEGINEEENWEWINKNCGESFRIDYRWVDKNAVYYHLDQRYKILNEPAYDIYGV